MSIRIGVAILALVSAGLAGSDEALERWQEHFDRGQALTKFGKEAVDQTEIRAADAEFALAVEVALNAGLHERAAEAYMSRITCQMSLPDWIAARALMYEYFRHQREDWGASLKDLALTRQDLGYLESVLRNFPVAICHLRVAEEYCIGEGDPDELAHVRIRMAECYRHQGNAGLALAAVEQSLAHFRQKEDQLSEAEALAVLSAVYQLTGQYDRAIEALHDARIADPECAVLFESWRQAELGRAYLRKDAKHLDDARKCMAYSLRLHAAQGRATSMDASYVKLHLAELELDAGCFGPARDWLRAVVAEGGDSAVLRGLAQALMGRLHRRTGHDDKAAAAYREGLAAAQLLGEDATIIDCEAGLAELRLAAGEPDAALVHIDRALVAVAARCPGRSPVTAIEDRERCGRVFDLGLAAAFLTGDPEHVFAMIEKSRAGVLLEGMADRGTLVDRDLPYECHRRLDDARARVAAAQLAYNSAHSAGIRPEERVAERELRSARNEYRLALDVLQRGSPAAVLSGARSVLSLRATRDLLTAGQAMVLFALAKGRQRALVITPETTTVRDLGPAEEIAAAVADLRRAVEKGDTKGPAAALRKRLLDSLALPAGCRRLLVSPDGCIASVPFALLDRERSVSFIPSATAYAKLVEQDVERGHDMLAMGDPVYPEDLIRRTKLVYRAGDLGSIPSSGREVREATGPGDVVLVRADATEHRFRRALARRTRWRAIHLACHGLVNRRRPLWSALALSPEAGDDGYLTVLEVYGLRVPADLVVLSACRTGIGESIRGEGQLGLPAAFMYAGSSRVIASLWDVEDDATCVFMRAFYDQWKSRPGRAPVSAGEALHHARGAVRKAGYDNPRHWAGWVLWGNPDERNTR